MNRNLWVKIDPWNKEMVTTAIESGADAVMVPEGYAERVRELGRIVTIAPDGDLKPGEDVLCRTIACREDEPEILRLCRDYRVILECPDWTVIPLENLIAQNASVVVPVKSIEEAETAFGILEKGVDHLLIEAQSPEALRGILLKLRCTDETLDLQIGRIASIRPVGMGDRVCVDTCSLMHPGEGLLVGNSGSGLFLIHAETLQNPYVSPRPFRVNAGPVHAYTRMPGGKTAYLADLKAGETVLVVDSGGKTRPAVVGRLKIERRPLMMIAATVEDRTISVLVQNAETIRLTRPDGSAVSVVGLQQGDEILVRVENAGRHFGHAISETIIET